MKIRELVLCAAAGFALGTPAVHADVMLGAVTAGNGWVIDNVTRLNNDVNQSLSYVNIYSSFTADWDLLYWQTTYLKEANMVPLISWMPIDRDRPDTNILPEIALGYWDDYLENWGNKYLAWAAQYPADEQPRIMIRFGHEFNGNWYPWGDSPEWYQAAYRYVHDFFTARGFNDRIEWIWCASNTNVDSYNDFTRYYPGDEYVDWTSLDGFNWGSNYTWTAWESFSERFATSYRTLVSNYPDKPIMIAEVASAEPHDIPDPSWGQNGDDSDRNEDKEAWNYEMLSAVEQEFPAIRAMTLFNVNKELDWSINDNGNTGLQGFNTALMSGHFTPDFLLANQAAQTLAAPQQAELAMFNDETAMFSVATSADNKKSSAKAAKSSDSKSNKREKKSKAVSEKGKKVRSINPGQQRKLALSTMPAAADPVKEKRMRNGFLNMSETARQRMKSWKLGMLENE